MDASPPNLPAFVILCLTSIMHQNWALEVTCTGKLTLDPGPLVEWGSSLSVFCQINECRAGPQNPFSIKLNYKPLHLVEQNCTTARLHIANMTALGSHLFCLVGKRVVCGIDLKSGHRPAKATQFNCFTPIKSDTISCSWINGRETHLPTNYSVRFSSVNGSKYFPCQRPGCSSVSIPRTSFSESAKYDVHVVAQNALGISTSDVYAFSVRDVVIPNAPTIKWVNFTHMTGSSFLMTWNSLESSEHVKHRICLGAELIWEGNATQSSGSGGSVAVEGLKSRTMYTIELRVCTQVPKPKCSLWSAPMGAVTPGFAPTQKPVAWRTVGHTESPGVQNVTVLWESMESEDFKTLYYEVSYWHHGQRLVPCSVNVSEVRLQLPAEVKEVNLTVVTSAGSSPPASLSLTHTNIAAPVMRVSSPKEDTVLLSWLCQMKLGVTGFPLGYVIQWQCKDSPVQWRRLSRDCNSTYIRGLKPGWRYDVLLQAETTRGLSKPAFLQVYSAERKPLSGPKAFIHSTGSKHIQVIWEEPTLEDQRGFITHYTIYIRKHGTGYFKPMFQVNASSPREQSLDTLDTGFELCISAWNAAGEGLKGVPISYQRLKSDGMFVGIWVVAAVSLVLVANLICLKCARTRIRAACVTVGPAWLFETFPKVGNSNAIKLLKDERCGSDSLWMSVCSDSDPPISPVEDIAEPIAQTFLFPSVHDKEKAKEVRVARPEIVDPYKPQWADSCQVSSTHLSETPEVAPEEDTEEECPLWACLPQPSYGKDIGLGDVTLGGFKGIGVTGNLLCPPLLDPKQTEWHTNMSAGMRDMSGFSLALLTEEQTVLPNDLLTTRSPQINPYSPQGCWLKVAHNT
ncbi:interleukin-23 receptor [Alosa sapidissima]|uniref:interleukin-23 receptor n=1 Tax=Alosa sapidissima TaxID=34773 RepID=UPI001C0989AA|nr:interleukin-23 receptor [Alosa sapidissima]XP_041913605.1 interleukin-23 receptor [Alosa sapidissima]XP_041913606.1 interleukin-23 receptor [Alosa sapidissima]